MVVPPVVSTWRAGCAARRRASGKSHFSEGRSGGDEAPVRLVIEKLFHTSNGSSSSPASFRPLLHAMAATMRDDLHARGVLCNATFACTVTVDADGALRVCLPQDDASRNALLCEPWGDEILQRGTPVSDAFNASGCTLFNVLGIVHWWRAVRRHPVFLHSQDGRLLKSLLRGKPGHAPPGAVAMMKRLLPDATDVKKTLLARGSGGSKCAVVGSGHDLVCYKPSRGSSIDGHDAIWRANAAQHYQIDGGSSVHQLMHGAGSSRRGWRMMQLMQYRGPEWRAGSRTTHRINCLFDSFAVSRREVCIVSNAWFRQPWGRENFMNTRRACCNRYRIRSRYTTQKLLNLSADGLRVRFVRGAVCGDDSLNAMLRSSGGNALHGAIAQCQTVNVYGAGLYSDGVHDWKRYVHYYDTEMGIPQCTAAGARDRISNADGSINASASNKTNSRWVERWIKDRVRTELLMHVLHAMGIINWIQA